MNKKKLVVVIVVVILIVIGAFSIRSFIPRGGAMSMKVKVDGKWQWYVYSGHAPSDTEMGEEIADAKLHNGKTAYNEASECYFYEVKEIDNHDYIWVCPVFEEDTIECHLFRQEKVDLESIPDIDGLSR